MTDASVCWLILSIQTVQATELLVGRFQRPGVILASAEPLREQPLTMRNKDINPQLEHFVYALDMTEDAIDAATKSTRYKPSKEKRPNEKTGVSRHMGIWSQLDVGIYLPANCPPITTKLMKYLSFLSRQALVPILP